jgi:hypothetical protein
VGLGFLLLLGVLFAIQSIQSSWTFRGCKSDYENDLGNQAQDVRSHAFVNRFSEFFYVRLRCDGKFVVAHPEVISFFAVGLITLFTGILWIFVSRILKVTQKQLLLTDQSIEVTKNLLFSLNKPEISVRGFSLVERTFAENQKIHVSFTVTNKGNSAAIVTEAATAVIVVAAYIPVDIAFAKRSITNVVLKSGEASHWPATSAFNLTAPDLHAIRQGECRIVCVGHFTYQDAMGTFRMTGFARQYDIGRRSWSVVSDSDYEYRY